jgi:polar amino acid transport system permease protein
MAETIRAGIQAVPKGQMEAARSLGMSQTRAMVSIVIRRRSGSSCRR